MKKNNLRTLVKSFIELSYNSKKWDKWMIKGSNASMKDKALISGHYIFATKEFKEIYKEAKEYLHLKKINLNKIIKNELIKSLQRYTTNLGIEK